MNEEQHIIHLLKTQDKRGVSILYDRYIDALYGVALRIVRSEDVAEDVVQDAFVKVWKHAMNYDASKGSLFTWLLNITRNTAIDRIRSAHYRHQAKIQNVDAIVHNHKKWSVSMKEEHVGLRKIVGQLDEKYREVIDLVYFRGFTQQEVQEHLKIPLGTVKSRIRIALRELRKTFDHHIVSIATVNAFWNLFL
ncbi:MAG: sigma-70 family RNA polymerase sigma factor [Bacteroidota bacterium]